MSRSTRLGKPARGAGRALAALGRVALLLPFLASGGCASFPEFMNGLRLWISPEAPVARATLGRPVGSAAGHHAVGRIDLAEGRLEAAEDRFRQALRLDPWHLESRNALGVALSVSGRHDEAIAVLREALRMFPETAHLLGNLGHALQRADQLEEAGAILERAIALDPTLERSRENLAQLRRARTPVQAPQDTVTATSPTTVARPASGPASSTSWVSPPDNAVSGFLDAPGLPAGLVRTSGPVPVASPDLVSERGPVPIRAIEVMNAAGVNQLARRTAQRLAGLDARVHRLTESRPFDDRPTEVHYRSGHRAAADALRRLLPIECGISQVDTLRADVNLRLVAGRDLARAHARW